MGCHDAPRLLILEWHVDSEAGYVGSGALIIQNSKGHECTCSISLHLCAAKHLPDCNKKLDPAVHPSDKTSDQLSRKIVLA